MSRFANCVLVLVVASCWTASVWAQAARKDCRYAAAPNSTVTLVNQFGRVTVKPVSGHQVTISCSSASDKVEVDCSQVGSRIDVTTRFLQPPDEASGRVDYELSIPPDVSVFIRNAEGPIRLEGVRGDIALRSDTAPVEVRNVSDSHVHVLTIDGPITLENVSGDHIEILSTGGDVHMTSVSGPKVTVSTTTGAISFIGDFHGGGEYAFTNHSGNIDVTLPAFASVDMDARSFHGSVQNDFPLQQKVRAYRPPTGSSSFAGTSNLGFSSVVLRSFSGRIRVSKQ